MRARVYGVCGPAATVDAPILRIGLSLRQPGQTSASCSRPWLRGSTHRAHIVDPTQQEPAEPEHRFDDAEYRLGRLLAQGVEFLALGRLEVMIHRRKRRGVL